MGRNPQLHGGSCMCGTVKYEVTGEPFWVGHCHCRDCRRRTGAPIVTYAGFSSSQVKFLGDERQIYHSSPGVKRGFCGKCGTPLTYEGQSNNPELGEIYEFHIGTLDEPDAFKPTSHLFYPERISWMEVQDDLPRFRETEFNGDPECYGSIWAASTSWTASRCR